MVGVVFQRHETIVLDTFAKEMPVIICFLINFVLVFVVM